jgi:glycosyltransferase involved in cell wall biosynthesis
VRSGIADYSRDLLIELDKLADVRVVRVPGQPVADEILERWQPVAAELCGEGGRLPVYQMGNNRHHAEVLNLARQTPGVVTLHDLVLHHLLVENTLAHEDIDGYRERLAEDHGWIGEMAGRSRRWGESGSAALFELPAHRSLIRRQRGVLVHSRWAADLILEENPDLNVRSVPMAMPLGEAADDSASRAFRERHSLPADAPLLGSFGFQTPIKRTEVVIDALARPELDGAHLLIAGEVSGALDLEGRVRAAGVEERVHITGFLDYDEFLVAIGACDLCVNLRYPTAGETSASLLRVLAVGRPVVVSDYAQFSEFPDSLAVKVPLGDDEVRSLANRAGELLARPERLVEMSGAAREFIRARHDPERAAAAVVEALDELSGKEPPAERPLEVPAPTTLTWLELSGSLAVEGGDAPWPAGESRRLRIELTNDGFCRWLPTAEEAGGVLVELQWREHLEGAAVERAWADLPREVAPGESFELELEARRPLGAEALIIEPHVVGVAGFSSLGGPRWVADLGS